jgi:hypothetical protein
MPYWLAHSSIYWRISSCREKASGHLGLGSKGIAVQVRWHVAGATRISVGAPGAAHALLPFKDHEIEDTGFLQLDTRTQTGETGSDDGNVNLFTLYGHDKPLF